MPRWEDVRPTLVAIYDLIDAAPDGVADGRELASALGITEDEMPRFVRDLRALHDDGYMQAHFTLGVGPPPLIQGTTLGRHEVRGWPGPRSGQASAELLVDLLRAQADDADTPPEQKTKTRAILDAIGRGGTDALSKVTAELILRAGGQIT